MSIFSIHKSLSSPLSSLYRQYYRAVRGSLAAGRPVLSPSRLSVGRGIKGVGPLERSRAVWCRRRSITSRLVKGSAVAAYPPI